MNGSKLPLRLTVEYISFSAHVDYKENSEFIEQVGSKNLVLVHGDSNEMGRLKSALTSKYAEREVPLAIHTPRNTETVELHFRGEKTAKVIGALAQELPVEGTLVHGILVSKDFSFSIMAPQELDSFTDLVTTSVLQRQTVRTHAPLGIIKWHLEQMYGALEYTKDDSYRIFNAVSLYTPSDLPARIVLEWDSNPIHDMIADSIVTVILQAQSSPASVKVTKSACSHSHSDGAHDKEHSHKDGEKKEEPVMGGVPLSKMITRHLGLAFGTDNVTKDEDIWTVNVDEDSATLSIDETGHWVFS